MTPKEFAQEMRNISLLSQDGGDNEIAHCDADDLLCQVLRELGYGEGVDIFEEMDKWYA